MTSTYDARGRRVGATIVEVGPNFVTQIKTSEKDGYEAIQLGFSTKKSVKKPQIGQAKKAGVEQKLRFFREVSGKSPDLGKELRVGDVFTKGDAVKVAGVSKGKGFQGGVRRHGFAGGPKTHGQSDRHRAPGSIGSGTTPGRVLKGKKMAGHMGAARASVRGLEIISVDRKNNLLVIKGGIPGAIGSLVEITKLGRIKGYIAPPEEKIDEEEGEETKSKVTTESAGTSSESLTQLDNPTDGSIDSNSVKEEEENAS